MIAVRRGAVSLCVLLGLIAAGCASRDPSPPRLSLTLPFGALDPAGEPQSDGNLTITGWVLSEDPVATVSLYIDGRYITSARMYHPRPDVNRAYPAFGAVNAGWTIEFDTSLFGGDREILVQARTAHGAVRDLGSMRRHWRD